MENSRNTDLRPGDENPNSTSSSTTAGDESLTGPPPSPSSANPSSTLSQIDADFEFACMLHELENSRSAEISTEPGPGDENDGLSSSSSITGGAESSPPLPESSDTSSSRLSQIDEDYALACMLQQRERVLMMLRNDGEFEDEQPSGEGGQEEGGVSTEELDAHPEQLGGGLGHALDLFEAEVMQAALQLMSSSRLDEWRTMSQMIQPNLNFQGNRQYPDFNNPSYEELSELCEMVGSVNKGLSKNKILSLPSISYKSAENGSTDQCVICLLNFEDGDSLVSLSCEHLYHRDCIRKWLLTNKVCPICNAEVNLP
ncbi:E3 ubiquitin ligase BIG BROTHER-related-like [Dioscorea cayenensis subsp. rotundata]|uniref:E3 ubiquitin ligase BIG BROTHER-related-like n=1 Tax=Dioscorea cayennensis subsp. rotundata TaxID=55577 RepID=A0AB40B3E2_DIOCR|nr:E3 ubiquitin ligase BIG BROTHER-related-like [Dioscorea cayenensis subsp. rotundata]